ncbi:MAG: hypothetical protein PHP23_02450 [Desulfobacterales bacterium]|nr:hypothetical protein [Desulfobacterales bacterium]MDD4071113.1 hypothetical protein [Desulfobacterales bacterium]MDD4393544.1 hypothetical protein [Desulfobacterales bacterium]
MDDFLHKLRTGQDRRNLNRRQYNNPMQRGTDRRDGNKDYRKNDQRRSGAEAPGLDPELLSGIKSSMASIEETLKQVMLSEERRAVAQERTADALEFIVSHIQQSGIRIDDKKPGIVSEPLPHQSEPIEVDCQAGEISTGIVREKVVDIIKQMREAGSTYDIIAMYLDQEKIPTFSGKGNWHAQTVHRIFRQNS